MVVRTVNVILYDTGPSKVSYHDRHLLLWLWHISIPLWFWWSLSSRRPAVTRPGRGLSLLGETIMTLLSLSMSIALQFPSVSITSRLANDRKCWYCTGEMALWRLHFGNNTVNFKCSLPAEESRSETAPKHDDVIHHIWGMIKDGEQWNQKQQAYI